MAFRFPCALYPIVDDSAGARPPRTVAEQILGCGIPLIQLRVKFASTRRFVELARELADLCKAHRAQLIINDRCDVAQLVGAHGVHLGQDDLDPGAARRILGPDAVIGYSTHNPAQFAEALRLESIDYVAYGPIFGTTGKQNPDPPTGLDELRAVASACPHPLVAIGGIGSENLADVLACGADAVAVIGAIGGAVDPQTATRDLLDRAAARR